MPLYEYACPVCTNQFELLQPMASSASADCPNCEAPANRLISLMAPAMVVGAGGQITAVAGGGCACGGNCACSA
jgi:putative FmdB family regulatory protein